MNTALPITSEFDDRYIVRLTTTRWRVQCSACGVRRYRSGLKAVTEFREGGYRCAGCRRSEGSATRKDDVMTDQPNDVQPGDTVSSMNPLKIQPDDTISSIKFLTDVDSPANSEWGRISGDGTVTITAADGTKTIASAEEAIAMYVRVAVQQGWPPLSDLVYRKVIDEEIARMRERRQEQGGGR